MSCRVWNSHIAELIDQHRTAHELDDDQLSEIIRLFDEARSACSALRFDGGLVIYEAIPIGPVASRRPSLDRQAPRHERPSSARFSLLTERFVRVSSIIHGRGCGS
jgi:hypothetical protein